MKKQLTDFEKIILYNYEIDLMIQRENVVSNYCSMNNTKPGDDEEIKMIRTLMKIRLEERHESQKRLDLKSKKLTTI